MVIFAGFISYWFYNKLGVDFVYIRPLNELFELTPSISLGIFFPILTFLFIMTIVHAINITDGLDGLAGGMMAIILTTLLVPTFLSQAYITSTLIGIVIASLLAFMWYNINPAKVFMGDS